MSEQPHDKVVVVRKDCIAVLVQQQMVHENIPTDNSKQTP